MCVFPKNVSFLDGTPKKRNIAFHNAFQGPNQKFGWEGGGANPGSLQNKCVPEMNNIVT